MKDTHTELQLHHSRSQANLVPLLLKSSLVHKGLFPIIEAKCKMVWLLFIGCKTAMLSQRGIWWAAVSIVRWYMVCSVWYIWYGVCASVSCLFVSHMPDLAVWGQSLKRWPKPYWKMQCPGIMDRYSCLLNGSIRLTTTKSICARQL